MSVTSVSLLDRLRSRADDSAWRRFVSLYDPLIRHWLRPAQLPHADVDDLVQDVLTVVFREMPKFQQQSHPGAFRAWLRAISVHRVRDFLRARNYRPKATGDSDFLETLNQLEDPHSQLSSIWNQEHDQHVLRHLFAQVQPEFQPQTWQAFHMVMLKGTRPAEVAARLGISVNAVLLAKSRILARLRHEAAGLID